MFMTSWFMVRLLDGGDGGAGLRGPGPPSDIRYAPAFARSLVLAGSVYWLSSSTLRPSERISLTSTLKLSGNAGFEGVVAAHDGLVDLGAARHVVRLHRQHFLQV
jgi:hypothetical protein